MNADRKVNGQVGVIGPTRLNYGRIVPIVNYGRACGPRAHEPKLRNSMTKKDSLDDFLDDIDEAEAEELAEENLRSRTKRPRSTRSARA